MCIQCRLLPPQQPLAISPRAAAAAAAAPTGGKSESGLPSSARSGAVIYAQHLRQLVAAVAKEHRSNLSSGEAAGDPMVYISVLSAIFEVVASVVHDHSPIVLESFGSDGLQLTLQELQLECDFQADKVVRACVETRGLMTLCQRVAQRGGGGGGGEKDAGGPGSVDPQQVSSILDELGAQHSSLSCRTLNDSEQKPLPSSEARARVSSGTFCTSTVPQSLLQTYSKHTANRHRFAHGSFVLVRIVVAAFGSIARVWRQCWQR